jgi:hypothetical protein
VLTKGIIGRGFFLKKYLEKPQREINIAAPKGKNVGSLRDNNIFQIPQ